MPQLFRFSNLDFKHVLLILVTVFSSFLKKPDSSMHVGMRAGVEVGPPLRKPDVFSIYHAGTGKTLFWSGGEPSSQLVLRRELGIAS